MGGVLARSHSLSAPSVTVRQRRRAGIVSDIAIYRQLRRLPTSWRLGLLPVCRPPARNVLGANDTSTSGRTGRFLDAQSTQGASFSERDLSLVRVF